MHIAKHEDRTFACDACLNRFQRRYLGHQHLDYWGSTNNSAVCSLRLSFLNPSLFSWDISPPLNCVGCFSCVLCGVVEVFSIHILIENSFAVLADVKWLDCTTNAQEGQNTHNLRANRGWSLVVRVLSQNIQRNIRPVTTSTSAHWQI